jgi:hypothetical protein
VVIIAIGVIAWSFESAVAQSLTPGPPGPYVIDFRGATSGVPTTAELYPDLTIEDSVPTRGFGFDVGAHVYRFHLGAARFGLGANYVRVRGTAGVALVTTQLFAPQLSFNFGTSNGWSYLSAGFGPARIEAGRRYDTTGLNAGGGARWFTSNHLAVSFDIRMYRLSPIKTFPRTTLVSASVGVSMK